VPCVDGAIADVVIPWYTAGMKTAVSLPDDLFASADALARRLGMSRSALVAAALAEFVAKHRASKISERLDAVYSTEESRLDAPTRRAQTRALRREDW
jgi:metal-responsive CopG/Arc/MetJ family transcriptional regulator